MNERWNGGDSPHEPCDIAFAEPVYSFAHLLTLIAFRHSFSSLTHLSFLIILHLITSNKSPKAARFCDCFYTHLFFSFHKSRVFSMNDVAIIHYPPRGCNSRSAGSVGTVKIRIVLVCPRPPFQPCTAMTVVPGLMMFNWRAENMPKRKRLST